MKRVDDSIGTGGEADDESVEDRKVFAPCWNGVEGVYFPGEGLTGLRDGDVVWMVRHAKMIECDDLLLTRALESRGRNGVN